MDLVEIIVSDNVARRARLFEQFLIEHQDCWPGPIEGCKFSDKNLVGNMKCSCGAWLEVTILTKLIVNGYQPK